MDYISPSQAISQKIRPSQVISERWKQIRYRLSQAISEKMEMWIRLDLVKRYQRDAKR